MSSPSNTAMSHPSARLRFTSVTTDATVKSQPGMAAAAPATDTPTVSGLSTPPTSPPIRSLGRTRSSAAAASAALAPPAVEGQQLAPIGPERQRYATHNTLQSTPSLHSTTQPSPSASVDRAVRALMAELDASIFRNVSSAVSAIFLDVNDVGHFVSMPHLGACASPEANHIMRSIEETLTRHAGYLLDPTDRAGLEAFGDALARKVSSDPRVLTPLAKVLIVLRLGHTATAARQGNHPAVAAMVPEFPLFMDAHVQIQARKVGGSTFASWSTSGSVRTTTSGASTTGALGLIAEADSTVVAAAGHSGLHRSASLHTSPSAAARVHFASPPESPSATTLTFAAGSSRPFTAPTNPLTLAPAAPRPTLAVIPATRKRTVSMPATSAPSAHAQAAAAAAAASSRPKTEVAVVLESMIADTRSAGGMMRHPVYLLHVQDAAAAASAAGFGMGTPRAVSPAASGGSGRSFMP